MKTKLNDLIEQMIENYFKYRYEVTAELQGIYFTFECKKPPYIEPDKLVFDEAIPTELHIDIESIRDTRLETEDCGDILTVDLIIELQNGTVTVSGELEVTDDWEEVNDIDGYD